MSSEGISTRSDLLHLFQTRMENTQEDLVDYQELDYGNNMLKTQIIESNISFEEFVSSQEFINYYRSIDSDLHELRIKSSGDTDGDSDKELFIDAQDDRFWTLYSLRKSKFTNDVVHEFISTEESGLDRTWMHSGMVETVSKMGDFQGVGIKYEAEKVFSDEFINENLLFGDLKLNSSGNGTSDLYRILQDSDGISNFLSLSNVLIRRESEEGFVRERITNDGGFTTRGGNDIRLHLKTVNDVRTLYSKAVESIEKNHLLQYNNIEVNNGSIGSDEQRDRPRGTRVDGNPLIINLSRKIKDIEDFIDNIVTARDPLRLWGTKTRLRNNYYKVKGVDMHNGDKITLEFSSDWIRIYLYEGACGNTALRLFTNIQHYYDPAASMEITDV